MKLLALPRRRSFWLFLATLLLFVYTLPALLAAWLPLALAPFGIEEAELRLGHPGWRAWQAERLAFAWQGPDGLRLRFAGETARYDYQGNALSLEQAELSLEAWPLRRDEGQAPAPLAEWPLLPIKRLDVTQLRLRLPLNGEIRQADGRLKIEPTPDGGVSLVLYMTQGLPDALPGRFELRIAPDGKLSASAGLSRGKTTVFFTELHLDAPPAHAPAFRLRSAGDLRPFYRWLKLTVPEEAQVTLNLAGRLPARLDRSGWLDAGELKSDFTLQARHWQLPWGEAETLSHTGSLDYRQGQGRIKLQGNALDAKGIRLPPFHLDGVFWRDGDSYAATGLIDSAPLKSGYAISHDPVHRRGELGLTGLEIDVRLLWPLLKPRLPTALQILDFNRGQLRGELHLPWQAGKPGKQLQARLALKDLDGHYQGLSWRGGQAEFRQDGLRPLAAQGSWAVDELHLPSELSLQTFRGDFTASGSLEAPTLGLRHVTAQGLGGSLALAPLDWQKGAALELVLDVEDLDMRALLALAKQPALSGAGRLRGRLPIRWQDGVLSLGENARLRAQGGALRYVPGPAAKDENIGLSALRDFRYKRLDADLRYAPDGAYGIRLELEGANPALYNGYPIAFTLNLEGRLPDLLRTALLSGDFAGHVLNSVEPRTENPKPGP